MNVQMTRLSEVKTPVPDPIKSTILDHYPPVDNEHFGLRNDAALFPSFEWVDVAPWDVTTPWSSNQTPIWCRPFSPSNDGGPQLLPDDNGMWRKAVNFTVRLYAAYPSVGAQVINAEEMLRERFKRDEAKAVESALGFAFNDFANNSTDPADKSFDDNGQLQDAKLALALLEAHAAQHYSGLPTIHAPRFVASLLNERIVWDDAHTKAYTRLGSKVAMGGGYDDRFSASGSAGRAPLYVTGDLYIERSSTIDISTFTIPGDGTENIDPSFGFKPNTHVAMIERLYRVAWDGPTAVATATAPYTQVTP